MNKRRKEEDAHTGAHWYREEGDGMASEDEINACTQCHTLYRVTAHRP